MLVVARNEEATLSSTHVYELLITATNVNVS